MWIVKIALSRPYTFIVLAILILIAAPVVIVNTPTAGAMDFRLSAAEAEQLESFLK